ncbi:unnamed protein product [Closterium sp. Naga37s-1]|nr:unnamed protein product [Closterium sp. Naga37s-1]
MCFQQCLNVHHTSLPTLCSILDDNQLTCTIPSAMFTMTNLKSLDVSHNSLYGRISLDFKGMVADGNALINLAHNFFSGDALLLVAGSRVCPTEASRLSNLGRASTFDAIAGKCKSDTSGLQDYSVAGEGKEVRGSVAGNCLALSPDTECSSNPTQRSTAACQAICSITANGPCDGHGVCVLSAPASPPNFTCRCDAGYSAIESGSGSTCGLPKVAATIARSAALRPAFALQSARLLPASPTARARLCCPRRLLLACALLPVRASAASALCYPAPRCPRALQPACALQPVRPAASAPCCPRACAPCCQRALLPARPAVHAPCAPWCPAPRTPCCPRAALAARAQP